jgi:ArsR family transcriptional regulator, arsenate/arsenite/antimonite-responsive transcriptional repressor
LTFFDPSGMVVASKNVDAGAPGPMTITTAEPPAACCAPLAAAVLSEREAAATASLFKALADPHRVRILNLLATSPDPVCVCDLQALLGLAQPTVSHHLKKLVTAGLLTRTRRGTWAYYALEPTAMGRLAAVTATPATTQPTEGPDEHC